MNQFVSISGSSNHGAQANKENGIGGPPDVNNLRLAGSGSGSESASDHNVHLLVNGYQHILVLLLMTQAKVVLEN